MSDPNNKFLFIAYSLVWIVFMLYAWSLARRQSKLRRDLEELKSRAALKDAPPPRES
jgi:CcmD family protein